MHPKRQKAHCNGGCVVFGWACNYNNLTSQAPLISLTDEKDEASV